MTLAVSAWGRSSKSVGIMAGVLVGIVLASVAGAVMAQPAAPDAPLVPGAVPAAAAPPAAPDAPAAPGAAPAAPAAVPAAPPATPAAPAKPKLPPLSEEAVTTRDGVLIGFDYLAGTKGKESVPVILLHGEKGSRKDYKDLAQYLQTLGHAVIVPDLRGHGTSTKLAGGGALPMANRNNLYPAMVVQDMESIKGFLIGKNNKEELNIEKLCVVGAEMGAAVACLWAVRDWSWPVLATGKQGQDVKALVLLSPKPVFKTLKLTETLGSNAAIMKNLSVLVCVGDDEKSKTAVKDAETIHRILKVPRPEVTSPETRDLFMGRLGTSLQGTQMLSVKALKLDQVIAQFIEERLVKQPFPWKARTTL